MRKDELSVAREMLAKSIAEFETRCRAAGIVQTCAVPSARGALWWAWEDNEWRVLWGESEDSLYPVLRPNPHSLGDLIDVVDHLAGLYEKMRLCYSDDVSSANAAVSTMNAILRKVRLDVGECDE